jgi:acyl carrier protein
VATGAGIVGVLKILLALQQRQIPPSLHFQQGNPNIQFANSPFYVNTALRDWTVDAGVRRQAAVSAFGFSGTNAHMVIGEAPLHTRTHPENPGYLVVLSARTAAQLRNVVANLLTWCRKANGFDLGNLSFTLFVGRKHWHNRIACVVRNAMELLDALATWLERGQAPQVRVASLAETGWREQVALKGYGNQCIDVCLASADPVQYLESLDAVAELYLQGYNLQFERLYDGDYCRLALPTYPFARERYWPDEPTTTAPVAAVPQTASGGPSEWLFFQEEWVPRPIPDNFDWAGALEQYRGRNIMLLYTDAADKLAFCALLQHVEQAVNATDHLPIRCLHVTEMHAAQFAEVPDVILFLTPEPRENPAATPDMERVSYIFHLSRYLMQQGWEEPVEIYFLYQGNSRSPRLDHEALAGFLRSAMFENERHVWKVIRYYDTEPTLTAYQILLREWLLIEPCLTGSRQNLEIRYHGWQRAVKRLAEAPALPVGGTTHFKPHGTYLIAGATGYIGAQFCRELARRYQATLVMLARRPAAQAGALCRELQAAGATVYYHAVDITDRDALARIWPDIKQQVGTLDGVANLTRTHEDRMIAMKSWDSFARVMQTKVHGSVYLDELTREEPLDFFMLFSSLAAFGVAGSSDYAYATAFQNAFARYRTTLSGQGRRSGVSIAQCWGPWLQDQLFPATRAQLQDAGYSLIEVEAGFAAIAASLTASAPVVGLMGVQDRERVAREFGIWLNSFPQEEDPQITDRSDPAWATESLLAQIARWEQQHRNGEDVSHQIAATLAPPDLEHLAPDLVERIDALLFTGATEVSAQPAPTAAQTGPAEDLATLVHKTFAEVMRVAEIDPKTNFSSYGMDSVGAMQLATRLQKHLQQEIQPQWLIDHPTINSLAAFLKQQQTSEPAGF